MNLHSFLASPAFTWVILPLLIFGARICDVSIGTIRVIFVTRGFRWYAAILGFFEVLIWLLAIGQIMRHLNNPICYIAYASGYAMGTFAGVWLEAKLSIGKVTLRVVTRSDSAALVEYLRSSHYHVTSLDAQSGDEKAKLVSSVVKRQDLPDIVAVICQFNPGAFYSVEDVRMSSDWPRGAR